MSKRLLVVHSTISRSIAIGLVASVAFLGTLSHVEAFSDMSISKFRLEIVENHIQFVESCDSDKLTQCYENSEIYCKDSVAKLPKAQIASNYAMCLDDYLKVCRANYCN